MRSPDLSLFAQVTTEPVAAGAYAFDSFRFPYPANGAAPIVRVASDSSSANNRRGQKALVLAHNRFEGVLLALLRFSDGDEAWFWPEHLRPSSR